MDLPTVAGSTGSVESALSAASGSPGGLSVDIADCCCTATAMEAVVVMALAASSANVSVFVL